MLFLRSRSGDFDYTSTYSKRSAARLSVNVRQGRILTIYVLERRQTDRRTSKHRATNQLRLSHLKSSVRLIDLLILFCVIEEAQ